MAFYSVSAVIGYAAGYKRLKKYNNNNNNNINFQCTIRVCGLFSEWFIPQQGIHQGDIFSMFLYCVYNNDLLEELRDIPCAVKIGNLKISGVGFADDISVMSTSLFTLQHLTDVCVNHSRKWRYEFGPSKICSLYTVGKVVN